MQMIHANTSLSSGWNLTAPCPLEDGPNSRICFRRIECGQGTEKCDSGETWQTPLAPKGQGDGAQRCQVVSCAADMMRHKGTFIFAILFPKRPQNPCVNMRKSQGSQIKGHPTKHLTSTPQIVKVIDTHEGLRSHHKPEEPSLCYPGRNAMCYPGREPGPKASTSGESSLMCG